MHSNKSVELIGAAPLGTAKTSAQVPLLKPEWLRLPEATRFSGIGRSSLYELMAEGKIKSACIRKRGNTRGIRLISADSISAYIESLAAK